MGDPKQFLATCSLRGRHFMRCTPEKTSGPGSTQQHRKHQHLSPKQEGNGYSRDKPGGTERSRLNAHPDRALVVREQQVGKTPHTERPNHDDSRR